MAVKIADTLKALSNTFPVAECVDIDVNINGTTKRLQKAIDDGEIGGGDSTWNGTREEWEALSTEEKGKYEIVYFTDDYNDIGIGESDSIWKGTKDEWEALSPTDKEKYVIVYFTDDYDAADSTGLIDDTNASGKTTYSSSKIENSLSKKANSTDLTSHTSDTNIHVTTSDKTKWNKVDNKVDKTDIIDNLTSTNTDKPLSANQGKILKGEVGLKANSTDLTSHTSDTGVHVTTADKTKWNKVDNKIDNTDIVDNLTSTDINKPLSANQGKILKGEIGLKANTTDLTTHTSNTGIHVTTSEKTKWNKVDNKIDKTSITTTINSASTDTQVPSAKSIKTELDKKAGTDKICHVGKYVCADSPITNDIMYRLYSGNDVVRFQKFIKFATSDRKVEWDYLLFSKDNGLFYQGLGEGKDLNDLHMNCFFATSGKCLNIPDIDKNFFGISLCYPGANAYSTQICLHANDSQTTTKHRTIYVRHCFNGTWGNWGTISSTGVADVPKTNIVPSDETKFIDFAGRSYYCVENGVCYVSFWNVQITSTGGVISSGVILPKPKAGFFGGTFLVSDRDSIPHAYAFVVPNTSELCFNVKDSNTPLYGSFSYPIAEE